MRKSTQAISLVLIGSTSLFFGCDSQHACNQIGPDGQPRKDCSGGVHGMHGGTSVRPGTTVGSKPSSGTTTGGFGSHGSSMGGGGASS